MSAKRELIVRRQCDSGSRLIILSCSGLGRWSRVTLEGPSAKKLSIITAYRVCKGSPQSAPLGSSFLREYEYFRERHHTSVNPRRQFLLDLQRTILTLQESGHSVILMLDANSTMDDKALSDFSATCGLNDLHALDPSASTCIGSADRCIDFIFGCDDALPYVIRAGILAYTEGPQSDWLYIDLSPEFIVKPPWTQTTQASSRDLHTSNPELVDIYNSSMMSYYEQHNMVQRIDQLYAQRFTMPRKDLRTAIIKWDNDQGRSMECSERRMRRPIHKCAWSPTLRNSAIIRRYWLLRLREHLQGSDFPATFARWQRQVQGNDPQFCLPSLGIKLTQDQVRHKLSTANNQFRKLQKQATPLCLQCYEDLLETYREDTDPKTKAESHRKANIVGHTISGEISRHVFGNLRRVIKPIESSRLSKVLVPPVSMSPPDKEYSSYQLTQDHDPSNILWETVVNRDELERHVLNYNRDSFRAAAKSPCGHGVIHEALTFSSLSPQSEALLSGIIPRELHNNDNYLREFLASFAIP